MKNTPKCAHTCEKKIEFLRLCFGLKIEKYFHKYQCTIVNSNSQNEEWKNCCFE